MMGHFTAKELDDLRRTVRRCERQWNTRTMPVDLVGGPLNGMRTVVDRNLGQGACVGWSIRFGDRQLLAVIMYRCAVDQWIFGGVECPSQAQ